MTRKDFLIQLWKYGLRPLLWAVLGYFMIRFVRAAVAESGTERTLLWLSSGLVLVFAVAAFTGSFFGRIWAKRYARFSPSARERLAVAAKLFGFMAVLATGAVLYRLWQQDRVLAVFLLGMVLLERLPALLWKERTK